MDDLGIQVFSNNWQFYQRNEGDWPISIRYDMAIGQLEGDALALFPHTVELAIPYIESKENGFPTKSEMERINAIEDGFSAGAYDVRLIGVLTGANCSRFVFCFGDMDDADDIAKTLMGPFADTEHVAQVLLNNNFKYYLEKIFPTIYEWNHIMNRSVCGNLAQSGDTFTIPRNIDFFCYFKSETHMHNVADTLCARGFAKVHADKTEQGDYVLHLTMEGIPALDWINGITDSILDSLEGTDGDFDGWGSPIGDDQNGN